LSTENEYIATLAAKRYQNYLKEEEKKRRYSKWLEEIITAILMFIKLIATNLEKINIKRKRVVEKVSIE
jgi:septin family protein